ncbi:integrase core domain-containing protein [Glutamicibacter sp. NPDC087583]|uniref:integrase core domain-containing protein n=1 Tax=Glutamicibacter sp. NPDC087583 TaxID=3363995 RepID=UPI0038292DE1
MEVALRTALWQRRKCSESHKIPLQGTIHHSDADAEYTSRRYTQALAEEGLVPSIGSFGDAFDDAAAETVMGLVKNEAVARNSPFRTGALAAKADLDDVVVECMHWYNNARLHSTLGYRTPVEFEDLYYDEITGTLSDVAASKLAA